MPATDLDLTGKDIGELTSADAFTAFLTRLGYRTSVRTPLTPEAIGLSGESAAAFKKIELLAEDAEGFLRVVFAQPRSLTARARNDLARVLGKSPIDHLLILASDYEDLEFVLLDKRKKEQGRTGGERVQVVLKTINVPRRTPSRLDLRTLRRLTWTRRDGLDQFDKLQSVFDTALYTGEYFQNRGLFSDYFLRERLREGPAWKDNPADVFVHVRDLYADAQAKWHGKEKEVARAQLFKPLFERLGFKANVNRPSRTDQTQPDYLLKDAEGQVQTAAFVYQWDRWLDGPDLQDPDTPEENPGACVVTALDQGLADWIIVTNGRLWRLYGKHAHARATNFYEVDLPEVLSASGDTDPNEAFRYFWLFFRPEAFRQLTEDGIKRCWLDDLLVGCRDYAKRLGERLKDRVFCTIFPHLAQGFLTDRKNRLGIKSEPTEQELADVFEATLTLLYRLLFLLYAESRDLLPIREAPYQAASLKRLKEEVADRAGVAEADVPTRLEKAYSHKETGLYDRVTELCRAMDRGDPVLNVPTYNGGLFITNPIPLPVGGEGGGEGGDRREQRIARFLLEHRVPDRYLALALDRLARDQDEKTFALVFIDYKSLEVRHLGSIYEGLLEFKLKVAEDDLTTQADKNGEKYVVLSQARPRRGRQAEIVVRKKEVYLSNDKAERKASGSYYTPDPIVEYIVAGTVGAVLDQKLEALRPEFRKVRKTFDQEVEKSQGHPSAAVRKGEMDHRQWAAQQTYLHHKDLVEQFFDLKVLDPAMGSGHFLVEAVDFITDRLLKFLNQFPINPVNIALERTRASILQSLGEQGVTVDPARLTDINLLKRHVLKRCIYGVDLNPMAVELAKVSLWLDAFTLGAPLNFLDHHLRCGNSLLGATFADLEQATAGEMFRLDYGPLLRAIHHVLFVSKMADATAAEASQSASEYASAREMLSGYQVVFDCLVAQYFGLPQAVGELIRGGQRFDLGDRERFLKSLPGARERQLVEEVESLAHQPDRRFFHWEIEFPEVFFGFADSAHRQIRHKDGIEAGSAGFDVVVGNPPYVRQEVIKSLKSFLKASYRTYNSTNDLYVYFQELEIRNLRVHGRMGMIVANKWMRAGYGEGLRDFLQRIGQPLEVIDFGHSPIFPDADTFPCILLMTRRPQPLGDKAKPADTETMAACEVPRENWHDRMDLGAFVAGRRHQIPTRLLRKEGWSLEDPRILVLLEKIRNTGVPLEEYAGCSPLMGLKTGFNEAFLVDTPTRDRLVREDKSSAEVMRPLLRGRDAARWRSRDSGCFLITIPSSENADWPWSSAGRKAEAIFRSSYPAIYNHFEPFRQALIDRQDQGRFYWELRSCDYMAEFDKPKIMWQEIQFHSWYCWDTQRSIVNNKVFFLPAKDLAILGVLCSPLQWWHLTRVLPHMKDEALSPALFMMEHVRIAVGSAKQAIRDAVTPLLDVAEAIYAWEHEVLHESQRRFSLPNPDGKVVSWLPLSSDTFSTRLLKLMGLKQPPPKVAEEIRSFHREQRDRQVELLTKQLGLERTLAALVEDAYGLDAEERALLRSTRPVRDPLDVLEARIRGGAETAAADDTE
jgi:hypothetical protein